MNKYLMTKQKKSIFMAVILFVIVTMSCNIDTFTASDTIAKITPVHSTATYSPSQGVIGEPQIVGTVKPFDTPPVKEPISIIASPISTEPVTDAPAPDSPTSTPTSPVESQQDNAMTPGFIPSLTVTSAQIESIATPLETELAPIASPSATPVSVEVQEGIPIQAQAIQAQDLVMVDTVAEGMKIIYAEVDALAGETQIWLSNAVQLDQRQLLVQVTHKDRYGVFGKISPDNNKIFYSVVPTYLSDAQALDFYSEIWVFDIESKNNSRIIDIVNGFVKWTPDGQALIYSQEFRDSNKNVIERKIYVKQLVSLEEKLIFSTTDRFGPVDFLNNDTLLYLVLKSDTLTELRTLNLSSGETKLLQEITIPRPWAGIILLPDKTKLLIAHIKTEAAGEVYNLVTMSLSDGQIEPHLTYLYDAEKINSQPAYRPQFIRGSNMQSLSIYFPPDANRVSEVAVLDLDESVSTQAIRANTSIVKLGYTENGQQTSLLPGFWSPDGQWLTLYQYPNTETDWYLLNTDTEKLMRIPATLPSHRINIIGWIE